MEFTYKYNSSSKVTGNAANTQVSFAPDSLRKPTFFVGKLKQELAFREAISALHDVVISDMRFQPKDRTEYEQWLAEEEERLLTDFIAKKGNIQGEIDSVRSELMGINKEFNAVMGPYYKAQAKYFRYLYVRDRDAWIVLDPVITVHPDEVFFECFSEDESSYGKLSCRYDVFEQISDKEYGTTNIDYSQALYDEFQKIRNYRDTHLKIDPDGFKVATSGEDEYSEKKIDLPDSWVRGFLQVSSAMTLPMHTLELHPMDIHNICFRLRRKKERIGPRAMRFVLKAGEPIRIIFEPWEDELVCHRSIYQGSNMDEISIRVWGRRRIHILERLIPLAQKFTLHLLGDGLPSFYIADLGAMTFTLGLSGWSANDWSRLGNFDLLAPRGDVDEITLKRIFNSLSESWVESAESLARRTNTDKATVEAALARYSQHGQVLYDLDQKVYRIRELSREPLPLSQLRFTNEREEKASNFVQAGLVQLQAIETNNGARKLTGTVTDNARDYHPYLVINADDRIQEAQCSCHFWHANQLRKGPCEHLVALRLASNSRK